MANMVINEINSVIAKNIENSIDKAFKKDKQTLKSYIEKFKIIQNNILSLMKKGDTEKKYRIVSVRSANQRLSDFNAFLFNEDFSRDLSSVRDEEEFQNLIFQADILLRMFREWITSETILFNIQYGVDDDNISRKSLEIPALTLLTGKENINLKDLSFIDNLKIKNSLFQIPNKNKFGIFLKHDEDNEFLLSNLINKNSVIKKYAKNINENIIEKINNIVKEEGKVLSNSKTHEIYASFSHLFNEREGDFPKEIKENIIKIIRDKNDNLNSNYRGDAGSNVEAKNEISKYGANAISSLRTIIGTIVTISTAYDNNKLNKELIGKLFFENEDYKKIFKQEENTIKKEMADLLKNTLL